MCSKPCLANTSGCQVKFRLLAQLRCLDSPNLKSQFLAYLKGQKGRRKQLWKKNPGGALLPEEASTQPLYFSASWAQTRDSQERAGQVLPRSLGSQLAVPRKDRAGQRGQPSPRNTCILLTLCSLWRLKALPNPDISRHPQHNTSPYIPFKTHQSS